MVLDFVSGNAVAVGYGSGQGTAHFRFAADGDAARLIRRCVFSNSGSSRTGRCFRVMAVVSEFRTYGDDFAFVTIAQGVGIAGCTVNGPVVRIPLIGNATIRQAVNICNRCGQGITNFCFTTNRYGTVAKMRAGNVAEVGFQLLAHDLNDYAVAMVCPRRMQDEIPSLCVFAVVNTRVIGIHEIDAVIQVTPFRVLLRKEEDIPNFVIRIGRIAVVKRYLVLAVQPFEQTVCTIRPVFFARRMVVKIHAPTIGRVGSFIGGIVSRVFILPAADHHVHESRAGDGINVMAVDRADGSRLVGIKRGSAISIPNQRITGIQIGFCHRQHGFHVGGTIFYRQGVIIRLQYSEFAIGKRLRKAVGGACRFIRQTVLHGKLKRDIVIFAIEINDDGLVTRFQASGGTKFVDVFKDMGISLLNGCRTPADGCFAVLFVIRVSGAYGNDLAFVAGK